MAPVHYTLRPLAQADLERLATLINDIAGKDITRNYIMRMRSTLERIAAFPDLGVSRDDLQIGLRTFAFERRVLILYRNSVDGVEVLRLLYGGREMPENINS